MFKDNKGFTLVEIAIFMIIIGLLIGGVLKGSQMINNAQISATIANMKLIQTAMITFKSNFNALPGDMITATSQLINCNTSTNCIDGDGDSLIGYNSAISRAMSAAGPTTTNPDAENWLYWKHLAIANLITGVDISDNGTNGGMPKADIGGIFRAGSTNGRYNCNYGGNYSRGVWLTVVPRFDYSCYSANGLDVPQISKIDRKIDDGMPLTGNIRGGGSVADLCAVTSGATTIYNDIANDGGCMMSYKVK